MKPRNQVEKTKANAPEEDQQRQDDQDVQDMAIRQNIRKLKGSIATANGYVHGAQDKYDRAVFGLNGANANIEAFRRGWLTLHERTVSQVEYNHLCEIRDRAQKFCNDALDNLNDEKRKLANFEAQLREVQGVGRR